MVRQILSASGFIEGRTFRETRFIKPPNETYAVFLDSYTRRGSDDLNLITEHLYTIELYSYSPDPNAEERIENTFDSLGIAYDKQDRYWLHDEQLYQVVYSFDYYEK